MIGLKISGIDETPAFPPLILGLIAGCHYSGKTDRKRKKTRNHLSLAKLKAVWTGL
jgi:hypothetical protein